jgi:hypothetical protein
VIEQPNTQRRGVSWVRVIAGAAGLEVLRHPMPYSAALAGNSGARGYGLGQGAVSRQRDIYKRLSSVQQEVFTHRHDRHQTSVSKAVARVVEVTEG